MKCLQMWSIRAGICLKFLQMWRLSAEPMCHWCPPSESQSSPDRGSQAKAESNSNTSADVTFVQVEMRFSIGVTASNPKTWAIEKIRAQNVTNFCVLAVCQPMTDLHGPCLGHNLIGHCNNDLLSEKESNLKNSSYWILTCEFYLLLHYSHKKSADLPKVITMCE